MLPRKLHLEQINRFHDAYMNLNKQIDEETDPKKQYELLMKFRKLIKLWNELDNFIENNVMHKLNEFEL